MAENINDKLENENLKKEFAYRDLDYTQVFDPIPDDLKRENKCLRKLIQWVKKYSECHDREKMEEQGYKFPPVNPGLSPENDWFIFERWMRGEPTSLTMKEILGSNFEIIEPEKLTDEEVIAKLKRIKERCLKYNISFETRKNIPSRLIYLDFIDNLAEEYEILTNGYWHIDGCSGYCPDCFQRPWCEAGLTSCWPEDEEAGEMFLSDSVKKFVSPSPVSLQLLQKSQAEHDREFEKFIKE